MTDTVKSGRPQRRLKTWSRMGELGRVPSEYEIVTHNLNHTMGKTVPLELGPAAHGNQWLRRYRDGMALKVGDWDGFRDPDRLIYREYTRMMDEQETYVDGLLEEYTERQKLDTRWDERWLDALGLLLLPMRYPGHGLQMMAAYVQQLSPSSYVQHCATFQAADELRRVQRIAMRTRQLAMAHPSRRFGEAERETWERHPAWQPCRKAVERLLVTHQWDEAFTALNLVIKPAIDELFLRRFAQLARLNGDELEALLAENLYRDAERSRRWSLELVRFAIERNPANRDVLRGYLQKWKPLADELVAGAAPLFSQVAGKGLQVEGFTLSEAWSLVG